MERRIYQKIKEELNDIRVGSIFYDSLIEIIPLSMKGWTWIPVSKNDGIMRMKSIDI